MVNKMFGLGMLVMVLVFGMTVVGCDNGSTNGLNNDPDFDNSLNGTWVFSSQTPGAVISITGVDELTFNNGTFEWRISADNARKGTYTVIEGRITIITTHLHGDNEQSFGEYNFEDFGLGSRWYSRNELEAAIRALGKWTDWVAEDFNASFSPFPPLDFSVDGNILNLGGRLYNRR